MEYTAALGVFLVLHGALCIQLRSSVYAAYLLYLLSLLAEQVLRWGWSLPETLGLGSDILVRLDGAFVFLTLALALRFAEHFWEFTYQTKAERSFRGFRHGLLAVSLLLVSFNGQASRELTALAIAGTYGILALFTRQRERNGDPQALLLAVALLGSGSAYGLWALGQSPLFPSLSAWVDVRDAGILWESLFVSLALLARSHELTPTYRQMEADVLKKKQTLTECEATLQALRTERKRLESELQVTHQLLIQADKRATLGALADGFAQDIASPNSLVLLGQEEALRYHFAVTQFIHELLGEAESPEEQSIRMRLQRDFEGVRGRLEDIARGSKRIRTLSEAIRSLARVDLEPSAFSLLPLMDECLLLVGSRLQGIPIEVQCPQNCVINAYRSQLGQVIVQLLCNAADAIEDVEPKHRQILVSIRQQTDQFELWLHDSGPGIPSDKRERVLEASYTTKSLGKGTGLGLAIVRLIVERHGGQLVIEDSQELGGAALGIKLPQFSRF